MFLIYNTMTFSVVQRRAALRHPARLGVTRREVFALILSEALLRGPGRHRARAAARHRCSGGALVRLVTQTINDLYFVVTVRDLAIAPLSLVKGAAARAWWPPCWRRCAARLGGTPRAAARWRSAAPALEAKAAARRAPRLAAGRAGAPGARRGGCCFVPSRGLVARLRRHVRRRRSASPCSPRWPRWLLMRAGAGRSLGRLLGHPGTHGAARRGRRPQPHRRGHRRADGGGLGHRRRRRDGRQLPLHRRRAGWSRLLQADIYISAPGLTSSRADTALDPAVVAACAARPAWPACRHPPLGCTSTRPSGPTGASAATENRARRRRARLRFKEGDRRGHLAGLAARRAVLVSEPFANRPGLHARRHACALHDRPRRARLSGGRASTTTTAPTRAWSCMSLDAYRAATGTTAASPRSASTLRPGGDVDAVVARPAAGAGARCSDWSCVSNRALRDDVAGGLRPHLRHHRRAAAAGDAGRLHRRAQRPAGRCSWSARASSACCAPSGSPPRQIWGLVDARRPADGRSSPGCCRHARGLDRWRVILIYVINRRSFGWTLRWQVRPERCWCRRCCWPCWRRCSPASTRPGAWRAPRRPWRCGRSERMRRMRLAALAAAACRARRCWWAAPTPSRAPRRAAQVQRASGGGGGAGRRRRPASPAPLAPRPFVFPADHGPHPEYPHRVVVLHRQPRRRPRGATSASSSPSSASRLARRRPRAARDVRLGHEPGLHGALRAQRRRRRALLRLRALQRGARRAWPAPRRRRFASGWRTGRPRARSRNTGTHPCRQQLHGRQYRTRGLGPYNQDHRGNNGSSRAGNGNGSCPGPAGNRVRLGRNLTQRRIDRYRWRPAGHQPGHHPRPVPRQPHNARETGRLRRRFRTGLCHWWARQRIIALVLTPLAGAATATPAPPGKKTPGFEALTGIAALGAVLLLIKTIR